MGRLLACVAGRGQREEERGRFGERFEDAADVGGGGSSGEAFPGGEQGAEEAPGRGRPLGAALAELAVRGWGAVAAADESKLDGEHLQDSLRWKEQAETIMT